MSASISKPPAVGHTKPTVTPYRTALRCPTLLQNCLLRTVSPYSLFTQKGFPIQRPNSTNFSNIRNTRSRKRPEEVDKIRLAFREFFELEMHMNCNDADIRKFLLARFRTQLISSPIEILLLFIKEITSLQLMSLLIAMK